MSPPAAPLLFVYGTLMRGFPLHRLLEGRARFLGAGTARGRLYDLGRYPGAVPDREATLRGEVYRVLEPALWAALDSVEGPQYDRQEADVTVAGAGTRPAFVYW